MADRVILMRGGKIEQSGSPDELYEKPASTFVAGFIGMPPMNLLAARRQGGRLCVVESDEAGQELILGVRPEHIVIADEGQPATVDGCEYFGADTIVGCRIGSQRLAVRVAGRPRLAPGAAVKIAWPDHAAHLFDARTGRRSDNA
jgi:sn-glycerol 3-phosphate transport system ATP-binding protein